jgi:transcriptional regulator with GAF, ATPase, and Fis domain
MEDTAAQEEPQPAPNLAPAGVFAELARSLAEATGMGPTLQEIVDYSIVVVPCDWAAAAATDEIGPHPARLAASTDQGLMATVAEIAGGAGTSPGWAAFLAASMVYVPDLAIDGRFPAYAEAMIERTPIRSVLSFGLQLREERLGVLSLYGKSTNSFAEDAVERARLLADHGAIAIDAELQARRAETLEAALQSNRTVGVALGILMERHDLTAEAAFDVLRRISSHTNRKLAVIAEELVTTGQLLSA